MIVVIADDLSGAAELAGAALLHGLSAEVQTSFAAATDADVVCLDTDTRLLPGPEAALRAAEIARQVVAARPAWVFKKCDSVLRGSVLAESRATAAALGARGITVLPANPSRGRIVRSGRYLVEGTPLHETVFRHDPAHPRLTDAVADLLGSDLAGVATPDAVSLADVARCAISLSPSALPVGGVDFFSAVLAARQPQRVPSVPPVTPTTPDSITLAVCGSAASWPLRRAAAAAAGRSIFALPHDRTGAIAALRSQRRALVGIGDGPATHGQLPAELAATLGESVAAIMADAPIDRLLLEGGATAIAVIRALGWTRLRATALAESGVGVLRPAGATGPELLVKPGSYPWPAGLWLE